MAMNGVAPVAIVTRCRPISRSASCGLHFGIRQAAAPLTSGFSRPAASPDVCVGGDTTSAMSSGVTSYRRRCVRGVNE